MPRSGDRVPRVRHERQEVTTLRRVSIDTNRYLGCAHFIFEAEAFSPEARVVAVQSGALVIIDGEPDPASPPEWLQVIVVRWWWPDDHDGSVPLPCGVGRLLGRLVDQAGALWFVFEPEARPAAPSPPPPSSPPAQPEPPASPRTSPESGPRSREPSPVAGASRPEPRGAPSSSEAAARSPAGSAPHDPRSAAGTPPGRESSPRRWLPPPSAGGHGKGNGP